MTMFQPHKNGVATAARHRRRRGAASVLVASTLLLTACGDSGGSGEGPYGFFEGETIEFVVPASPGGGSGTTAEILTKEFTRLSDDGMTVQPIYIDGGATVLGINDFARRDPDGLSIAITTGTNNFYYNYGDPSAAYDYEEWTPIMGLPQGRFVMLRSEFADLDPKELPNIADEIVFGHMGQLGGSSLEALVMDEILGVPTKHIFGYGGTSELATAFETGEVDAFVVSSGSFESLAAPMVESGEAEVFFVHPQTSGGELVADSFLPDAPTTDKVYAEIHGKEPSGDSWDAYVSILPSATTMAQAIWVHSDAPEEAVEAWVQMGETIAGDDEALAYIEKLVGYAPVVGADLTAALEGVVSFPDDHRNHILDFMVKEHGSVDPR